MKNSTIALLVLAILGTGGYYAYKSKFWIPKQLLTKEQAIALIVNSKNAVNDNNILATFGDQYVIDWGTAIANNQTIFTSGGKNYKVAGGKLTN